MLLPPIPNRIKQIIYKQNNMREFNLEQALKGAKVITRDGRPVRIAGYNEDAEKPHAVAGWLGESVESWSKSGGYYAKGESDKDLFMAPEKKEWWIGLFRKEGVTYNVLGINDEDLSHIAAADKAEVLFIGKVYEEE